MAVRIRTVDYFNTVIKDKPGEAYQILSQLASAEVNFFAVNAIPIGPAHTQMVLFPESSDRLLRAAEKAGIVLMGPQRAFLIQGDDQLGALVSIHRKLYDANINVFASSGVTDGEGHYGYILHVRPDDYDNASRVLGV
jgi:hypothetical protein